jgi:competence protein ComEA
MSARIVAYRDSAGPFASVEDLTHVPGIGPKTLEAIRDLVTVR